MSKEAQIYAAAKAMALTKVHPSKLTEAQIEAHKKLATVALEAAESVRSLQDIDEELASFP